MEITTELDQLLNLVEDRIPGKGDFELVEGKYRGKGIAIASDNTNELDFEVMFTKEGNWYGDIRGLEEPAVNCQKLGGRSVSVFGQQGSIAEEVSINPLSVGVGLAGYRKWVFDHGGQLTTVSSVRNPGMEHRDSDTVYYRICVDSQGVYARRESRALEIESQRMPVLNVPILPDFERLPEEQNLEARIGAWIRWQEKVDQRAREEDWPNMEIVGVGSY